MTLRLASVGLVLGAALADVAGHHSLAYYLLVTAVPVAALHGFLELRRLAVGAKRLARYELPRQDPWPQSFGCPYGGSACETTGDDCSRQCHSVREKGSAIDQAATGHPLR